MASPGLNFILQLQPVTYHFNYLKLAQQLGEKNYEKDFLQQRSEKTEMGLLAQQVEEVCLKLGIDITNLIHKPENDKDNYSLAYGNLVVPLIKAIQEINLKITQLDNGSAGLQDLKRENEKIKLDLSLSQQEISAFKLQNEQLIKRIEALEK